MKEVRQYKQLQSQLNTMLGDADALKIEVANKQREYNQKKQAIEKLKKEMEKLNNKESLKVCRVFLSITANGLGLGDARTR